jgi:creatinine amidohydrolase/Fe(II)-dependent formamide hydrolase-like protein
MPSLATPASLTDLLVIDELSVGPVRLEPNRLVAPYGVLSDLHESKSELVFRYGQAVFDPEDAGDRNLAAMMAAQVALNYGLFCRRILFHGDFDAGDRRFLRSMAENTAREIFVKKFLEPNPFLNTAASRMPSSVPKRYCQARLLFQGSANANSRGGWRLWSTHSDRCCVLSSGGKESLLSYALLDELRRSGAPSVGEVHPIFVNESGRHWFTAVNAYREFAKNVATTGRVWVNSDRIFNWMLRQLPFVRSDFAKLRSDEYPIRLWTVAVFVFAVLPLLRRHGIGRLIIGDEFDTSVRRRHDFIPHYDGLFDQSIWFDAALSRYFLQKGWAISQFSVLRPLSEMLVEKLLWERYPELGRLQTSCHAVHEENGRMHPCGRCEKCRRVVGMLTAIGADPESCGYTPSQIERCLREVMVKEVHQESAGEAHLRYVLAKRGHLGEKGASAAKAGAEAHPEILALRFDDQKAPLAAMPSDLRQPLWKLMLAHADGARLRQGRRWVEVDPFKHAQAEAAYPFEPDRPTGKIDTAEEAAESDQIDWGTLSWPQMEARLTEIDMALLPVGAIEQHGPHLPLDTDSFDAAYLARRVAQACSPPRPLVLPLMPYGVSYHHRDFKGTLSIDNDTLSRLVYDVGMSCAENGIHKLIIINAHGGNEAALNYAAQMINRDTGIFVCVDSGETSDVDIAKLTITENDVHAGEVETSTSLAVRPELVQMTLARPSVPAFSSEYLDFSSKRGISWFGSTRMISPSGVMGDPTRADAAKGEQIWQIMIAHLVAFIEDLKNLTVAEIHHRRT